VRVGPRGGSIFTAAVNFQKTVNFTEREIGRFPDHFF
jgi:hypothetical protein